MLALDHPGIQKKLWERFGVILPSSRHTFWRLCAALLGVGLHLRREWAKQARWAFLLSATAAAFTLGRLAGKLFLGHGF